MQLASPFWHLWHLSPVPEDSGIRMGHLMLVRTGSGISILFQSGTGLTKCQTVWHSQKLGKARSTLYRSTPLTVKRDTPCIVNRWLWCCETYLVLMKNQMCILESWKKVVQLRHFYGSQLGQSGNVILASGSVYYCWSQISPAGHW